MVRLALLAIVVVFLSGCFGTNPVKVKTEVQESIVTVLSCPAPPKMERPALPIHQITEEEAKQDGMIAKSYKATVKVLMGYAEELEASLKKYDDVNKKYEEQGDKLKAGVEKRKAAKETK